MARRPKHSKLKTAKGIFLLLLSGLLVPINYTGNATRAQNISNNALVKVGSAHGSVVDITTNEGSQGSKINSSLGIPILYAIWIAFMLVASTVLILSVWAYLDNLPLYRQCLLLYLYQDVLKVLLANVWFWSFSAMVCKVYGYGTAIESPHATFISYIATALNLALIVALNASCYLKLFIATSKTPDPIETICGCDDKDALQKIRLFVLILIVTILTLMYANDCNGSQYYLSLIHI